MALSSSSEGQQPQQRSPLELATLFRVQAMLWNMPRPGSQDYSDLTEFDLECVRHAGLSALEYLQKSDEHLRVHLEEIVDTLTTLRYGVSSGGDIEYIRTAMVPTQKNLPKHYPVYMQEQTQYALLMLEKHDKLLKQGMTREQENSVVFFTQCLQRLLQKAQTKMTRRR